VVDWGVAHAWLHTVGPKSVARTMGAANRAAVLQSVPISCHFHGCTALLILRFVVVKWRYIKYKALLFFTFLLLLRRRRRHYYHYYYYYTAISLSDFV